MPPFRVPISCHVFDPNPAGPIRRRLRAMVPAEVRIAGGVHIHVPDFIVDTGSSYTMMSVYRARQIGIELPETWVRLPITTASETVTPRVYDGELQIRFRQLQGRTFRLYCVFVEEMNPNALPILGLNDFFDAFRVTFDACYSPEAPAGHMLFETV
jgi:hypothetical protein